MLPLLFNPPTDERSYARFSMANADHHLLIANAILSQDSVRILFPPLDPIPQFDIANWARRHQDIHNDMNSVLGIAGVDLTSFDPKNQKEFLDWIFNHAQEHYQASLKLGVF